MFGSEGLLRHGFGGSKSAEASAPRGLDTQHNASRATLVFVRLCCAVLLAASAFAQAPLTPFRMPWDDASPGITSLASWQPAIEIADPWVAVNPDAHYEKDGRRLRFLGVNITAALAFPTRANADAHASRLARFGYNGVRFHHMEAPWDKQNVIIDYPKGTSRELSSARLDRLHYFVAALARNGVYTDVNLLVSREFQRADGLGDEIAQMGWKDQHILGFFNPDAMALHKEYAQKLLTAPNPYRDGKPLVEDPAVAIVEIMNENGLLQKWYEGVLDLMPARYRTQLEGRWNQWLKARYESGSEAMLRAWGAVDVPLADSQLRNGDFAAGAGGGWNVERHDTAVATVSTPLEFDNGSKPALRVQVDTPGSANWHIQINQASLRLEAGKVYTVSFWARAVDAATPLAAQVGRASGDFGTLSGGPNVALTADWREYSWIFQSTGDEPNARVNFNGFGNRRATVSLANVRFQAGGKIGGVPEGRSLEAGTVPNVLRTSASLAPTAEQRRDWIRFVLSLETTYWDEMRRYIKDDLGYRGIVFATIVSNSPTNTQTSQDAIDSHSYWAHPSFPPGLDFDATQWTVANNSMLSDANGGTIGGLARQRVKGKPHNVTEYQHSSPNTYASEGPLLAGAYGALQDWDSIWYFEYGTSSQEFVSGFFDQSAHAGKMANNLIAAMLFRRGDIAPAVNELSFAMTPETEVSLAASRGGAWSIADGSHLGVPALMALVNRLSLTVGVDAIGLDKVPVAPSSRVYRSDTGELVWDASVNGRAVFTSTAPRTKVLAGFTVAGRTYDLGGGVQMAMGATRQQWSTAAVSLVEGESFDGEGRALLVLTGDQENTGMVWKDASRTSVGNRWGGAPVLIEAVVATLTLPVAADRVKVWSLDGRGQRMAQLNATPRSESSSLVEVSAATLWYEIEIGAAKLI